MNEDQQKSGQEVKAGTVQFWGHGLPGSASMGGNRLNKNSFVPGSNLYNKLSDFKNVLIPRESSVWFRCCDAFHGSR